MPGFCNCGLRPRPSGGVKPRRSNGLAPPNSITDTKNAMTRLVTPATYGSSSLCRAEVSAWASAPKIDRMTAQNSSEPFWPAQNAETR